jgi:CRISPR-associated protein Csb1
VEKRRVANQPAPVECVLLDSVQSQANRMELALQEAIDAGTLKMPLLVVDFSSVDPLDAGDANPDRLLDAVGKVTSLQVPHRLADAILRDSEFGGKPFRKSAKGKALDKVSTANATALFELCPTALLFGMWDSTGPKGGLGPKFERAMVSEIVGIGAEIGDLRRGVRRDPLEIRAAVKVVKQADTSLIVADPKAKGADSPSTVNHSSVPFPKERDKKTDKNTYDGVTIQYAEQVTTLSLIGLRRLRFPTRGGAVKPERDAAARTVLAALGLCAATMAFEKGMALRSRCLLWPADAMIWDLLDRPGEEPKKFSLSSSQAVALLQAAVTYAADVDLSWPVEPVPLTPSRELVKLVRLSQLEAVKDSGGEQ